MIFNKKKCLALLKERKKLSQEGKCLRDVDYAKNKELIGYLTFLEDQIFWESRKEYCQMFDLFLSKKISLEELFKRFYILRGSNLKAARMHKENLEAEASGILTKSNESDFQLKQTQDDLKQTQHILGQVKEKSEAEIKQIRQEHQVEISKLHVTLNRFNRAALKSAKRETDMRTKIAECKNKLAEAIELRDSFEQ